MRGLARRTAGLDQRARDKGFDLRSALPVDDDVACAIEAELKPLAFIPGRRFPSIPRRFVATPVGARHQPIGENAARAAAQGNPASPPVPQWRFASALNSTSSEASSGGRLLGYHPQVVLP